MRSLSFLLNIASHTYESICRLIQKFIILSMANTNTKLLDKFNKVLLMLKTNMISKKSKYDNKLLPLHNVIIQIICDYIDFEPKIMCQFLKLINKNNIRLNFKNYPLDIQDLRLILRNLHSKQKITGLNIYNFQQYYLRNVSNFAPIIVHNHNSMYMFIMGITMCLICMNKFEIYYTNNITYLPIIYWYLCTTISSAFGLICSIFYLILSKNCCEIKQKKNEYNYNTLKNLILKTLILSIYKIIYLKSFSNEPNINQKIENISHGLLDILLFFLTIVSEFLLIAICLFINTLIIHILCIIFDNMYDGSFINALYLAVKNIRDKSLINFNDLEYLRINFNNLEYLKLEGEIQDLTNLQDFVKIQHLDLSDSKRKIVNLKGIDKLIELKKLNVDSCQNLKWEDIINLEKCHKLKKISFRRALHILTLSGKINNSIIELNLDQSFLKTINLLESDTLRHLSLSDCQYLKYIKELKGLINLESIDLSYCEKLKNINALVDCKLLSYINICGCKNIIDISELKGLINLENINLSYCEKLKSIDALVDCKLLSFINISGCKNINDISELKSLKLKKLNVSFCYQFYDSLGIFKYHEDFPHDIVINFSLKAA